MSQRDGGPSPRELPRWMNKKVARAGFVAFVSSLIVCLAMMQNGHEPPVSHASPSKEISGWATFYSAPDNDPPGSRAIAYPGPSPRHAHAGGSGTYGDPQTFATAHPDVYPIGTIIYMPRFQRYFVMEDLCECSHGSTHVDLWLEPSGDDSEVLACERQLTTARQKEPIIVDPDPNLPVDLTPLIDDGVCRVP